MADLTEIVRSALDPLMKGLEQRVENLEESKKKFFKRKQCKSRRNREERTE